MARFCVIPINLFRYNARTGGKGDKIASILQTLEGNAKMASLELAVASTINAALAIFPGSQARLVRNASENACFRSVEGEFFALNAAVSRVLLPSKSGHRTTAEGVQLMEPIEAMVEEGVHSIPSPASQSPAHSSS